MKKIFLSSVMFIFALVGLALPSLFLQNNLDTEIQTVHASTSSVLRDSGITNEVDGTGIHNVISENKTGAVSYLTINLPASSTNIIIRINIAGIETVLDYNNEDDEDKDENGRLISESKSFDFTTSGLYTITYTLGGTNYNASCNFSPIIVTSNLSWLKEEDNNKFYASTAGTHEIVINNNLYQLKDFTLNGEKYNITISADEYQNAKLTFVSKHTNQYFTLDFLVVTITFKLGFYQPNLDLSDESPLYSVWKRNDESSYNIFNSAVKVRVEIASADLTQDQEDEIYDLYDFNITGATPENFTSLNKTNFLFNEAYDKIYTLQSRFKHNTGEYSDIDSFKIITILPTSSTLKISFAGTTGDYDYIKDYFKNSLINSSNSTLNVAGIRNLSFTESSQNEVVYIPVLQNDTYFYSFNSNTGDAKDLNKIYAFKFIVNYQNTGLDYLSKFVNIPYNRKPDNNKFTADFPTFDDYSFTIDTSGFNSVLKMRLTYNGIIYDYTFNENPSTAYTLNLPGDYVIEFYGFNDYETLKNVWSDATGSDYNNYKNSMNYNDATNNFPALKRSFRITGSYTTAKLDDGSYLFNNQLTNSSRVLVRINRPSDSPTFKYEVFHNNIFYSGDIANITTDGAVFTNPGLWTIYLYQNSQLIADSTFSFTIISGNYQAFSFYSNPITFKDIEVKLNNSTLPHPVNNTYHLETVGNYAVNSVYTSIFTLRDNNNNNVASIETSTNSSFNVIIKKSDFTIELDKAKNGDRITGNVIITTVTSNINVSRMEVYLNGKLIKTYNASQTTYIEQMSADDRTFTENGVYTIIIFDIYNNSYQLQVEKYYKMNAATAILIAVSVIAVLFVLFLVFKIRRGVRVK